MSGWLRAGVRHWLPALGLVIVLLSFLAVVAIWANVRDMEHSRYAEHREFAANIAETSRTFIVSKQYDYFYEVVRLLTTLSFVRSIGLYLDNRQVLRAGDLKEGMLPPSPDAGRKTLLPQDMLAISQPLEYHATKKAVMLITFSLKEVQRAMRGIYQAFAVIVVLLLSLVVYGLFLFRSEAVKSKMIRAISHDAMHSFNPIYSKIYNLLDQKGGQIPAPELQRVLKQMRENTNALKRVLENLKDNERLAQGNVKTLPKATELYKWVQFACDNFEEALAERKLQLTLSPPPAAPVVVLADKEILKSVFMNLLDNAIKYSKPGSRIKVWIETSDAWVKTYVADQGRGIARKDWEKIFRPFVRVIKENEKIEGTGLGLSNSRQLIRLSGGELGIAESRVDAGTTFYCMLPATAARKR